jgi:hypothetical protein
MRRPSDDRALPHALLAYALALSTALGVAGGLDESWLPLWLLVALATISGAFALNEIRRCAVLIRRTLHP